jgi:hypothetical protein
VSHRAWLTLLFWPHKSPCLLFVQLAFFGRSLWQWHVNRCAHRGMWIGGMGPQLLNTIQQFPLPPSCLYSSLWS